MGMYNGKMFRYIKAGAAALDRGKICVAPTVVANHINMSFTAAPAAGATTVTVTLGATAATADQYKGGLLVVNDGTGEGRSYPVEGNLAADSSGTCTVYLKEAIDTLGAVSETNVDLLVNDYNGAVISITDGADRTLGVPLVSIAIGYYGWIQSGGPCAIWVDETLANGIAIVPGTSVAGSVEAADAAGEMVIGSVSGTAGVDTEYQNMYLTIDKGFFA